MPDRAADRAPERRRERDSRQAWRLDTIAGTMLPVPPTLPPGRPEPGGTEPSQPEPSQPEPSGLETWTTFRRADLHALIEVLRRVARSGDGGAYGFGVEVVVESPTSRTWEWIPARWGQRHDPDRAHIAVTDRHGRCGYPVHVRLYTARGPDAGRHLDRRSGWATTNTAGQAILMMKAAAAAGGYDVVELATGTVDALADLQRHEPVGDWRFRIERAVIRH